MGSLFSWFPTAVCSVVVHWTNITYSTILHAWGHCESGSAVDQCSAGQKTSFFFLKKSVPKKKILLLLFITSAEVMQSLAFVRLSAHLLACWMNSITQKIIDGFSLNFHPLSTDTLVKSWLNIGDVNVTVAYFKAMLKSIDPLAWQGLCSASASLLL